MRLLLVSSALALPACSGPSADLQTPLPPRVSTVSPDLVAQTWQVRLATDAARAPFENRPGWVAWFAGKRAEALQAFAAENDPLALARAHAEYAAMYRQAAMLAAHATSQVYGADAQVTDPAETSYLLGVSGALLGDQAGRSKLGLSAASTVPALVAQDRAWKDWRDAGSVWPPDAPAAGSPGASTAVASGQTPGAGALPHYLLPERADPAQPGTPLRVDAADPGTLWALARGHEAAAIAAAGENAAAVHILLDPWRLPAEPKTVVAPATAATPVAIPDTFLFMSFASSAGDLVFLSDLARDGVAAVATHQLDSPYAAIVSTCTKDAVLSVDCVLDESAALGQAIEAGMVAAAGKEDSFFRYFADFARTGALRAADRAAETMGDREASGRLRLSALDRTTGNARDPLFLLSVAAWDAGNRNSVRAEELVHGLLTEVPGLEAARLPLDALHIRLSRTAAPGLPMH